MSAMTHGQVISAFPDPRHDHGDCIDTAVRQAESACRARRLRLTPIRREVLELVWQGHRPVKAYELLDQLRASGRRAAPPTVYRALEFLLEAGFIHRLESLNAFIGCGDPQTPHAGQFLICRSCSAVAELDVPAIADVVSREARDVGFRVDSFRVEIEGLCPECARA